MASTVVIANPQSPSCTRISVNRARRHIKKGVAEWIKVDLVIRFLGTKPDKVISSGPKAMHRASYRITQSMIRYADLRAAIPAWPSQDEIKKRELNGNDA